MLFLCALSGGGAVFLIAEMDGPFDGVLKVSAEALRYTIALSISRRSRRVTLACVQITCGLGPKRASVVPGAVRSIPTQIVCGQRSAVRSDGAFSTSSAMTS